MNGTESWRYGVAVDQKFLRSLFGGLEFSWRDLEVPYTPFAGEDKEADWDEEFGRVYLYWTPHEWFALSAEYQ